MVGRALQVIPWKRYGKERLYVNDETGRTLGWHDLLTGATHVEEGKRQEVEAALANYRTSAPAPKTVLTPDPIPAIGTLASNLPGQALSVQAELARRQAPFLTFLARLFGIHTKERAWRVGMQGEQIVARELLKLDGRWWRFLHSVPVGAGTADIDHVAIGPGGVFTLNTKHHPGANVWVGKEVVMVNGQGTPYVRNARHEAARASRLLSKACGFPVAVQGAVVIVGAEKLKIKGGPPDVEVIARRRVAKWLRHQPGRLRAADVDRIHRAASNPETWKS